MALLLKYRLDTGAIVGGWQSNTVALVTAQMPADDSEYGYLLSDDEGGEALATLQAEWYVVAEALVAKELCTLTATPSPFAADGVSICTITVAPFVACTLLVQGASYALTLNDPTLELTAEVPDVFTLTVEPLAAYTIAPLTVEAV